jgi:hypothetical protein
VQYIYIYVRIYIIYIHTLIRKGKFRGNQSTGVGNKRKSSILRTGRIIAACDESTRNVYEPVVGEPQGICEGKTAVNK